MNNVEISKICGLCAGCKFAIDTAEDMLKKNKNVAIFKEIVHNHAVNKKLIDKGITFVEDLDKLNNSQYLILRAHGEPKSTYQYLQKNHINFSDCTCFNVKNIHQCVDDFSKRGFYIIIIGKYGKHSGKMHPEVLGTIGWCNGKEVLIEDEEDIYKLSKLDGKKFYLVCQTTFNETLADDFIKKIQNYLQKRNCEIIINKSICGAQKAIMKASLDLAKNIDLMIVIGSEKSSNSTELAKKVEEVVKTIFFEDIYDIKDQLSKNNVKLSKDIRIGITAGASVDKNEVFELKDMLQDMIDKL